MLWNATDDFISSKFVQSENVYSFRESTLQLLVKPRFASVYLSNQPIVQLIKLSNEYKSTVTKCVNRTTAFKNEFMEKVGSERL